MNKIIKYLQESVEELKKVTWPTQKETYNYSLLVIIISVSVAAFLGGIDFIFNKGLEFLIK